MNNERGKEQTCVQKQTQLHIAKGSLHPMQADNLACWSWCSTSKLKMFAFRISDDMVRWKGGLSSQSQGVHPRICHHKLIYLWGQCPLASLVPPGFFQFKKYPLRIDCTSIEPHGCDSGLRMTQMSDFCWAASVGLVPWNKNLGRASSTVYETADRCAWMQQTPDDVWSKISSASIPQAELLTQ